MRRVLSLAIAGAFTLLFSVSAQAQTLTFTASLNGGNEVPGVVTGSAGTATVTWNLTTKAGTYRVDVFNMPVGTTASHIHVGAAGVAGPVIVNFTVPAGGISNDYALVGTFGCSDVVVRAAQGINSCEDFEQAIMLNNTYVNVHSTVNAGGEIRGPLMRVLP
jgi:fibronectin-binding autotransporter adhesin